MMFKYVFEATVIRMVTGLFYPVGTFLLPSIAYRQPFLNLCPEWMGWAWVVFSIPFMWIALNLSVRRAMDANVSPWFGLAILLPVFNFFVMLMLSIWPSRGKPEESTADKVAVDTKPMVHQKQIVAPESMAKSAAIAVGVGMLLCLALTTIGVLFLGSYGVALFLGMPLLTGTIAGSLYNRSERRGILNSATVGAASVFAGCLSMLLFGLEGMICIVMAAPLVLPLGVLGGVIGYSIANAGRQPQSQILGALIVFPLLAIIEPGPSDTRVAYSSVEVAADAAQVWQAVIAFPEITEPPGGYFEYGIAYPIRARIDGAGVGAVRYCEFTTGSFVEPITHWQPPLRLGFDVSEQPDPMVEMTPYRHIHPPHLRNSFRSVRGEFRIVPLANGNVRLEGRTWYKLDIGPTFYWELVTDKILHDIHMRVLNHIKRICEE